MLGSVSLMATTASQTGTADLASIRGIDRIDQIGSIVMLVRDPIYHVMAVLFQDVDDHVDPPEDRRVRHNLSVGQK